MDQTQGSVPINPGPMQEAIHSEYIRALQEARDRIDVASQYGRLHPEVTPSQVDELRALLSTVVAAVDAVTGPRAMPEVGFDSFDSGAAFRS